MVFSCISPVLYRQSRTSPRAPRGPRAAPAATAREEILEDVLEERSETRVAEARTGTRGRAEAIEVRALVRVGQDGVRLVHLFEPLLRVLVAAVAVRVKLHGELAVGLLDVGLAGAARDAEHLVVVAVGGGHHSSA